MIPRAARSPPIAGKDFCLSLDGSGNGGADACTDVRLLGHSDEGDSLAMPRDGSFLYVGGVIWGSRSSGATPPRAS